MRLAASLLALGIVALLGMGAVAAAPLPVHDEMPASIHAPRGVLPVAMRHAGQETRAAYAAALSHPEVLDAVPCTCGCVRALGHRTNLDCYIEDVSPQGTMRYTTHGLGCLICQAITRDALAAASDGLEGQQLYDYIVARYGTP